MAKSFATFIAEMQAREVSKEVRTPFQQTKIVVNAKDEAAKTRAEVSWAFKTGGMFALDKLGPFKPWGHGVPTIRTVGSYDTFNDRCSDAKSFGQRLAESIPVLKDFDFAKYNMVLAGGAAAHHLRYKRRHEGDYDIFLVGHANEGEALQAITALGDHLKDRLEGLTVHRTVGCITFTAEEKSLRNVEIQVVLGMYPTVESLLYGFDLGSSAVAYDGKEVWLSWPGKLAFERGVNVLDLRKRRIASYESRIARYFSRGFGLVVPRLNMAQIPLNPPFIKLPFLIVSRINVHKDYGVAECRCCVDADSLQSSIEEDKGSSHYQIGKIAYGDARAVLEMNLKAIIQDNDSGFATAGLCASAEYTKGMDVTKIQPQLNLGDLAQAVQQTFSSESVRYKTLINLLGVKLALQAIVDHVSAKWNDKIGSCKERLKELEPLVKKMVIPFTLKREEIAKYFPALECNEFVWYGASGELFY